MLDIASNRGFTLVELLVVLVIAVALAGIAVPQFSRALTHVELRRSTQEIAALLRLTRDLAVSESRPAELTIEPDDQALRIDTNGLVYYWPDDVEVELLRAESLLATDSNSIRFYPDGTATQGLVTVSALEQNYTIAVDWLTGHVKVL